MAHKDKKMPKRGGRVTMHNKNKPKAKKPKKKSY